MTLDPLPELCPAPYLRGKLERQEGEQLDRRSVVVVVL
jgi:hypothetical protein